MACEMEDPVAVGPKEVVGRELISPFGLVAVTFLIVCFMTDEQVMVDGGVSPFSPMIVGTLVWLAASGWVPPKGP